MYGCTLQAAWFDFDVVPANVLETSYPSSLSDNIQVLTSIKHSVVAGVVGYDSRARSGVSDEGVLAASVLHAADAVRNTSGEEGALRSAVIGDAHPHQEGLCNRAATRHLRLPV